MLITELIFNYELYGDHNNNKHKTIQLKKIQVLMNNNQVIVETIRIEYKITTIELNLLILISIESRE